MAVFKSSEEVYLPIPSRVTEGRKGTPDEGLLTVGVLDVDRRRGYVVYGDETDTAFLLAGDGTAYPLTESAKYQRSFPSSRPGACVVPVIETRSSADSSYTREDVMKADLVLAGVAKETGPSNEVTFDLSKFDKLADEGVPYTLDAIKRGLVPAAWAASSQARVAEGVSRPQQRLDALESQVAAKEARRSQGRRTGAPAVPSHRQRHGAGPAAERLRRRRRLVMMKEAGGAVKEQQAQSAAGLTSTASRSMIEHRPGGELSCPEGPASGRTAP